MSADRIAEIARERIEKGSKSFAAAARLFDRETRESVHLLYAWCRRCDDEIDGQALGSADRADAGAPAEKLAAIDAMTRAALAGGAGEAEFAGLARVFARHAIPERLAFEHLAGFAMDAAGARYRTVEDTLTYSWHVAGAVGVMMAQIMGAHGPDTLARASDLGIAFQLTNIARDVIDDAKSGRIYLPEDWLGEEGVTPEQIVAPENRAAVHRATVRLLELADRYYASAGWGIARLRPRAALAIGAARAIYRSIGRIVISRGPAAWDERAVVGAGGKAVALVKGGAFAIWARARAQLGDPPPRTGLWTPPGLGE